MSSNFKPDLPVLAFPSAVDWRKWLEANHAGSSGIWLRFFKKGSGHPSVYYPEAVDEALCYGWIDGQRQKYDADSWVQRYTPRRPKSQWSKLNTDHVQRLSLAGKMAPAGLREVEAAQQDGRWDRAMSPPRDATLPEDFLLELEEHPQAKAFLATLSQTNVFAIVYRLESAKRPETRQRRMRAILAALERGENLA